MVLGEEKGFVGSYKSVSSMHSYFLFYFVPKNSAYLHVAQCNPHMDVGEYCFVLFLVLEFLLYRVPF